MNLTRKDFLFTAPAFAAAVGLSPEAFAATGENPFRKLDVSALRKELRAFYPDECHEVCKDPRQTASVKAIGDELDAWAAAHPGYDALDIRREEYLLVRKHFVPFLFKESPFYFEAGVNGGWCNSHVAVPGRHVNRLCHRFYHEQGLVPDEAFWLQGARHAQRLSLCCGPLVDDMHHVPTFHTILTKGFKGVRDEVAAALKECPAHDPLGKKELETALVGLDTIHEIQLKFHEAAKAEVEKVGGGGQRKRLLRIIEASARCPWEPPKTFFEALNALWFIREIPAYIDGLEQFSLGRPDAWFIDLYRADLKAGRITEAEARELVAAFLVTSDCHLDTLRTIDSYADQEAEMPLTLGGCDTQGRPVWNELTEMFLDAHIGCDCVFPKLHCRMSKDSPEAYLRKIGEMLMAGHAVFALFNDERHIEQFVRLGLPLERARDYVCTGCWDGNVDSWTDVDCANYMSPLRILELTIYRDPEVERRCRLRIDPIDDLTSFEAVRDTVFRNFNRFFCDTLSEYTRYGRASAKVFPHPAYTMCLEGGIRSRRDTTDGGVAFCPRIVTLAFMANVVDSLASIRQVCFVDKKCTLKEFLAAVRSNWAGARGEELRQAALRAPYWGDDSEVTNGLMKWYVDRIADSADGFRNDRGGPYALACWIYREFIYWGEQTKATPDGRRDGDRLAQGFSPSEYRCNVGPTTVFNAIGSLDHSRFYATNANLSFEKDAMSSETFASVFRVVCRKDMHLLQPNCHSLKDLLDAQVHPERHQDIIVKCCGFSARFVALSKRWQDEVIARHRLK